MGGGEGKGAREKAGEERKGKRTRGGEREQQRMGNWESEEGEMEDKLASFPRSWILPPVDPHTHLASLWQLKPMHRLRALGSIDVARLDLEGDIG